MRRFFLVVLIATLACRSFEPTLLFRPVYKVYIPMVQTNLRAGLGYQVEGYLRGREQFFIQGAIVLLQVHWSDVEATQGVYQWPAELDHDVGLVDSEYLILSVKGSPAWSRNGGIECEAPLPAYYSAFGRFVRALADRYHPFAIEGWNEPDANHRNPELARFFGCIGDGQVYAGLIEAAYRELQGTDVKLIAGALLGNMEFWGAAVAAGINEHCDVVSFHAYVVWPNPDVSLVFAIANRLSQLSPGKPLYLTETSVLCDIYCDATFQAYQVDYLSWLHSQMHDLGIEIVLWYSLANNCWRNSDLVINDIRKPAWFAMERILR